MYASQKHAVLSSIVHCTSDGGELHVGAVSDKSILDESGSWYRRESASSAPSVMQNSVKQTFVLPLGKLDLFGCDLVVASSSSVLMLVVVELSTSKFPMESVDVFLVFGFDGNVL